jgi:hypothetical protein
MRLNPGERSLIRYLAIYRLVGDLVDLQRFNFNVTALRISLELPKLARISHCGRGFSLAL